MAIPAFRSDGYLPEGVHPASDAEVTFRFGGGSHHRKWLVLRVRRWAELARSVGAIRVLVDGSFVTAKENPKDVDAIIFLPPDFDDLLAKGDEAAIELREITETRRPEELFAAEDEGDFNTWVEYFGRTRELDNRRKGLVEVLL